MQPNALIVVAFDKAMDKASAEAAFSLERTSDGAPVSGSFGWYGPACCSSSPAPTWRRDAIHGERLDRR